MGPPATEPIGISRIHDLALEASWAAKYAGLGERDAIRLVSRNVEDVLGLERSRDVVVWEGSPLQFGTPVLSFQAVRGRDRDGGGLGQGQGQGQGRELELELELTSCWPDEGG